MIKELNKLWHKKNSLECSTGGALRLKRKIDSHSLKALLTKFRYCIVNLAFGLSGKDPIASGTGMLALVDVTRTFTGIVELLNLASGAQECCF